jgi:hypothetical protein
VGTVAVGGKGDHVVGDRVVSEEVHVEGRFGVRILDRQGVGR